MEFNSTKRSGKIKILDKLKERARTDVAESENDRQLRKTMKGVPTNCLAIDDDCIICMTYF